MAKYRRYPSGRFLAKKCRKLQKKCNQLEKHSSIDNLTGLYRRCDEFYNQVAALFESADRNNEWSVAVAMIDVDNFKSINDTYGHDVGDMTLKTTADIIINSIRHGDVAARLGGDEFVVVLRFKAHGNDPHDIIKIPINRLKKNLQETNMHVSFSLSIGIGIRESKENFDQVLKKADLSMYASKKARR